MNKENKDYRNADCSGVDFVGASLSGASFVGADCSGADFTGADFTGANCSGAGFRHANLRLTDFRGADCTRTEFSRANLTDAILPYDAPRVEDLDRKILQAIEDGGKLDMCHWHTCQTTHCRAGWAVVVAGAEGLALESAIGTSAAAAMIYAASGQPLVPDWYASDEEAYEDIVARAAAGG